jgi:hypothetical protein
MISLKHLAKSETVGEAAQRMCPEAAASYRLRKEADEDRAVSDAASYHLSREAARRFYHFSTIVSAGLVRDHLLLSYVSEMQWSTRTNGEVIDVFPRLDFVLNELAYSTQNSSVQVEALRMRRDLRTVYRDAYKAVNGHYPTDAPDLSAAPATPQPTNGGGS